VAQPGSDCMYPCAPAWLEISAQILSFFSLQPAEESVEVDGVT